MNWLKKLVQKIADSFVLDKVIGDSSTLLAAVIRINKATSPFNKAARVATIAQGQLATITPLVEKETVMRGAAYYMEEIAGIVRFPATATVREAVELLNTYETSLIEKAMLRSIRGTWTDLVGAMVVTNRGGWSLNYHDDSAEKFYIAVDYHTVLNLGG